ncbi:DUF1799 domain-containing protein [Phenylobacterium sp.]|uniref:DUF1799 domain-containing protein n=1 Tax=Phenylobacterium sp. TaxID=1871053 RepID=UPI00391D02EB
MGELTGGELDGFAADLVAFGFADDQVVAMRRDLGDRTADALLDVMPENERAVRLLLALQTQWQAVALSTMSTARLVRMGLNYLAVEPAARMSGLGEVTADDFERLRVLEAAALEAWGEEARRK